MLHGTIRNDVILRNTASDSSPVVSLEKGETREGWWEGGKGKGETTGRSWVEKLTKKVKVTPTDEKKIRQVGQLAIINTTTAKKITKTTSHNFSTLRTTFRLRICQSFLPSPFLLPITPRASLLSQERRLGTSQTQHCNVGTMLQPFELMSQQCCNAVLFVVTVTYPYFELNIEQDRIRKSLWNKQKNE